MSNLLQPLLALIFCFICSIHSQPIEFASPIVFTDTSPVKTINAPYPLDHFDQTLHKNTFYGDWNSLDEGAHPFGFFDGSQGFMSIEVYKSGRDPNSFRMQSAHKDSINFLETNPSEANISDFQGFTDSWTLTVKIYDGEYVDQKSATIIYDFNGTSKAHLNPNNATIIIRNDHIDLSTKQSGASIISHQRCKANFTLYFLDKNTLSPWSNRSDPTSNTLLQYSIQSPECNLNLFSSTLNDRDFTSNSEIIVYLSIMTISGLITMLGALGLRESFRRSHQASRVSLVSLWFMSTLDYYLLIVNLALVFIFSPYVIIPALVYIVLTFYVERRLILKLLSERGERNRENPSNQDCKSCGFYFLGLSVLFILQICFIFTFKLWIIHLSALFLAPQIIHNAVRGKKYSMNPHHVLVMGLSRVAMIFYIKLYPSNIFRLSPDLSFILIYTGILLGQMILLFIQMKYPRFCCSRKKKKSNRLLNDEDICAICMGHLTYVSSNESRSPLKKAGIPTVETVCNHFFHIPCLEKWIKTKQECPVCRTNIRDTIEEMELSDSSLATHL